MKNDTDRNFSASSLTLDNLQKLNSSLRFSILKQGNNTNLFFINSSEMYGQKHRVKSKVSLLFIILSIPETIMEKQNTMVLTEVTKHSHSSGNTF